MYQHFLFGEIISWHGVSPGPRKVKALLNMPPPKSKKELWSFLGILNYLSMFSPVPAEVCVPLRKLILVKTDWSLNGMYQDLNSRAK